MTTNETKFLFCKINKDVQVDATIIESEDLPNLSLPLNISLADNNANVIGIDDLAPGEMEAFMSGTHSLTDLRESFICATSISLETSSDNN